MNPNGMYFFEIFERELEEASADFYGRHYEKDGDALYWDVDGNWYYSHCDQLDRVTDEGLVVMNSEALHWGRGVERLLEAMRPWMEFMEFECGLPPLLRGYTDVLIDLIDS